MVAVSEISLDVAVMIKVATLVVDAEKAETVKVVSAVKNGKSLNQIFLQAVPIFGAAFFCPRNLFNLPLPKQPDFLPKQN
ncbi:hypothetical protein D3C85_1701780 [compost metagenome]